MSAKMNLLQKPFISTAVFGMVAIAFVLAAGQNAGAQSGGLPNDWSHHHMIFTHPGTATEALSSGRVEEWYRIVSEPRYRMQQVRRSAPVQPSVSEGNEPRVGFPAAHLPSRSRWRPVEIENAIQRDWSVSFTNAGVAAGQSPAKFSIYPTAAPSCSDFVVYGVNQTGLSGSKPNIVGLTNLYVNSGGTGFCPGTAPTVQFSYYVGTGTVQTSPALSNDGTKVAYVESITGNGTSVGSKIHVTTIGTAGTIAAPVAPTDSPITLNGFVSVTRSSPFIDYGNNVAYLGDDSGRLHKIANVFTSPAECTGSNTASPCGTGWPYQLQHSGTNAGILTGPVYDSVSNNVYVGDVSGYVYSVTGGTSNAAGTLVTTAHLANGTGIIDSPIVDGTAKRIYVFVGDYATTAESAVLQLSISTGNITTNETATAAAIGTSSTTIPLYAGDFDNTYYSNGAGTAGSLYACGNAGGNPTLYQIAITGTGTMGTVTPGPVLASSNVACAPMIEFDNTNTSTDWLFASVPGNSCGATAGTTSGGCVMSFNITSGAPTLGPWTPSTAFALNSQIVDTNGNIQKCTAGCGGTGDTSATAAPTWAISGTTNDPLSTNATALGTVSAFSGIGGKTVTVGGLTLTASAPVAEIATISVPTSIYCLKPNTGFTVGTTPTNVITNGTAPTGGLFTVSSNSSLTGDPVSITLGGVTYTYVSSLGSCASTSNCILAQGTSNHPGSAEALARAINNSGTTCTTSGSTNPCYKLATGQGANIAVTASWTAASTTVNYSTWNCAGTAATQYSNGNCASETCTAPTGGTAGSTPNIIMPGTMLNTSLATAINTALTAAAPAGLTLGVSGSTVTLTASTAGSTGIHDALDGIVTGVNVAITTAGTDGSSTPPNFQYWSGAAAVTIDQLASNIAGAAAGNADNITLTYNAATATFTASGTGSNAGFAGNGILVGGTLVGSGLGWTYNSSTTTTLQGGLGLIWTYQSASNGQTNLAAPTGTSGMVIDNAGSGVAESNIYFGTLAGTGTTNSAVKLTQSGLGQ